MKARKIVQSSRPGFVAQRLAERATQSLRADLFAGLTVAMVAVPQGMAYAAIAGMPPIFGLFTAIGPAIAGSLFGSSRHLITGPTNAIALVTSGVLVSVAGHPDYVEFVFALALITGIIQLTLGVLRLGGIVRFVSNSVLTGFLTGASLLIIVNQLSNLLGLPRVTATETPSIVLELAHTTHESAADRDHSHRGCVVFWRDR